MMGRKRRCLKVLSPFLGLWLLAGIQSAQAGPLRLSVKSINVTLEGSGTSAKVVKAAVRKQTPGLRSCFKAALKTQKQYSGWLWLRFKFNKAGEIRSPSATSTIDDKVALKCVTMTLRRWTVKKGGKGQVTATVKMKR